MLTITVYSRPFTVSHKAGDCRSARPSKTTHLCSLWGRHQCTQLCKDGVTMPRGPAEAQHLQTFTRATHNPSPVGLKHGKTDTPSPPPFPLMPPSALGCSWRDLCSPGPVCWLPASPQPAARGSAKCHCCPLVTIWLTGVGSRWRLAAPRCFSQ